MQKKKILLIDDEEDFCFFVKQNLEATGEFSVTYTTDPQKALSLAKKESPDLMLMDIMMPKKDGFGVLSEIKEDKATMGVPVVMISALGVDEVFLKASQLYSEAFIIKPVSQERLIKEINEVLSRPPFANRGK